MRSRLIHGALLLLACLMWPQSVRTPSEQASDTMRNFLTALMKSDVEAAMAIAQPGLSPDMRARMHQGFSAMAGQKVKITRILEVKTESLSERNDTPTAVVFTRIELRYVRNNDPPVVREYRWFLIKSEERWYYDGGGF